MVDFMLVSCLFFQTLTTTRPLNVITTFACVFWNSYCWFIVGNNIAADDLYTPHTKLLDLFFNVVSFYER